MSSLFCEICGADRRREHREGCTSEEAGLHTDIGAARTRLHEIRQGWEAEARAELVGTFWRYFNSYSCPKGDQDRWWLYRAIYDAGDGPREFNFQVDKDGKASVERDERHVAIEIRDGWEPITAEDFWGAWRNLQAHVDALAAEAGL